MTDTWRIEGAPPNRKPFMDVSAVAASVASGAVDRAVKEAGLIGLAALRQQVASIGRVTGNLANSVMMRVEVRGPGRVFARVGFHHAGGRHAHLVEYGTLPRATKTKGIFSSAASRGKWVGMGTYPQNFISGKEFVRGMPALRPLQKSMEKARAQMTAVLEGRMRVAALAAIRAGAARELQGSAA